MKHMMITLTCLVLLSAVVRSEDGQDIRDTVRSVDAHDDDVLSGGILSWDVSWPRDMLANAGRQSSAMSISLHTYGQRFDWGLSVHSMFGTTVVTNGEDGMRTLAKDPTILFISGGHHRNLGSFWIGYSIGVAGVRTTVIEESIAVATDGAPVQDQQEARWAAASGVRVLVGMIDPGSLAAGLEATYFSSKIGTFVAVGLKIGVVIW